MKNDFEKVLAEIAPSEFVCVKVVSGDPPSHYEVTFLVDGLMWDQASKSAKPLSEHVVDIHLPAGYPKQAPRCTIRTPVWHPNIGDYICIGDFWSAGVTLADIIVHIAEMIQYKSYNLRSPVNKDAAAWASKNARSFPVGTCSIRTPETEQEPAPAGVEVPDDPNDLNISLGPVRDRR